jgi:hypothetical protein
MPDIPTTPLNGISSMATRQLLANLLASWQAQGGQAVAMASVGGVDAARRVAAGEAFDLVVLASDAIDALICGGPPAGRQPGGPGAVCGGRGGARRRAAA